MSNFYTTLGNALFGADFRKKPDTQMAEAPAIDAEAPVRKCEYSLLPI
jgi:hypothetical protein